MARRCKCHYCKVWIEKDENRVENNITEKQKKYFHPECLPKFLEEKRLKDIEVDKRNTLYEYIRVEIMGYTKEKQLTPSMMTKLLSLRNGSLVRRGIVMDNNGYDYGLILTTFKAKKIEIERAIFGKTFEDDNHKFNYVMVIVANNINDVAKRLENANKQKNKEKELKEIVQDTKDIQEVYNDYKEIQAKRQKKKNNNVANLLGDIL